jgi:hypothetical protein
MAIDGHITVWVSNGFAFARMQADTKAGPIIVQASAPLAAVRRRLEGEAADFVEGDEPARVGEAAVHRAAKGAAVGNLRRLMPLALLPPGALATYEIAKALRGSGQKRPAPAPRRAAPDEDDDSVEGLEIGADAPAKQAGAMALGVAQQDPKVRAGLFLLRRARKDPRARRQIRHIQAHAAAGNPQAKRDQAALLRAQKIRQGQALKQRDKDRGAARKLVQFKVPGPPPLLASHKEPSRYRGFFAAWERGAD